MRNLHSAHYTNLTLLLSDQCQHTTKVAVFADKARTVFKIQRSLGASYSGSWRIPIPVCSEENAVGSINVMVYRDYSFSGSIIINVNNMGMEFISIGGLLHTNRAELLEETAPAKERPRPRR